MGKHRSNQSSPAMLFCSRCKKNLPPENIHSGRRGRERADVLGACRRAGNTAVVVHADEKRDFFGGVLGCARACVEGGEEGRINTLSCFLHTHPLSSTKKNNLHARSSSFSLQPPTLGCSSAPCPRTFPSAASLLFRVVSPLLPPSSLSLSLSTCVLHLVNLQVHSSIRQNLSKSTFDDL